MLEDEAEDGEHVRLEVEVSTKLCDTFRKVLWTGLPGSPGGGPGGRARRGPCRSTAPGRSWGVSS